MRVPGTEPERVNESLKQGETMPPDVRCLARQAVFWMASLDDCGQRVKNFGGAGLAVTRCRFFFYPGNVQICRVICQKTPPGGKACDQCLAK